jgi:hypothetical protein
MIWTDVYMNTILGLIAPKALPLNTNVSIWFGMKGINILIMP